VARPASSSPAHVHVRGATRHTTSLVVQLFTKQHKSKRPRPRAPRQAHRPLPLPLPYAAPCTVRITPYTIITRHTNTSDTSF
jgi:hypothetical protein